DRAACRKVTREGLDPYDSKHRRYERYQQCCPPEIRGGWQLSDPLHQELQVALDCGEVGTRLIGLAEGEALLRIVGQALEPARFRSPEGKRSHIRGRLGLSTARAGTDRRAPER